MNAFGRAIRESPLRKERSVISKNINIPSMFNQLITSFVLPNLDLPSENVFSEFDLNFLFL